MAIKLNLKQFEETKGYFIGNFKGTVSRNVFKEAGIKTYKRKEINPHHFHKKSTEINVILEGLCEFTDEKEEVIECEKDDVLIIRPNEIYQFKALTDCKLLVIKSDSDPKDKYLWPQPTQATL